MNSTTHCESRAAWCYLVQCFHSNFVTTLFKRILQDFKCINRTYTHNLVLYVSNHYLMILISRSFLGKRTLFPLPLSQGGDLLPLHTQTCVHTPTSGQRACVVLLTTYQLDRLIDYAKLMVVMPGRHPFPAPQSCKPRGNTEKCHLVSLHRRSSRNPPGYCEHSGDMNMCWG